MALIRAKTSGGGGMPSGTVLWTNENPTSSSGFNGQDITGLSDYSGYDYLKISARLNNSNDKTISILVNVAEFKTVSSTAVNSINPSIVCYYASAAQRSRAFIYKSDTSITVGTCLNSGATGNNNTWIVPTEIRGIKF